MATDHVQIDAGETIADLTTLRAVGDSPDAPPVVRVNIARFGAVLIAIGWQAEALAAQSLGESIEWVGGVPPVLIVGDRYDRMMARPESVVKQHYFAVMGLYRWFLDGVDTPRASVPLLVLSGASSIPVPPIDPSRLGPMQQAAINPITIVVGVIGLAAVVTAGVAWWAGKREDAQAQIAIQTVRQTTALQAAATAIEQQIASGKPIDPALVRVLERAATPEEASSWGFYLAAFLAGGGTVGALGVALVKK